MIFIPYFFFFLLTLIMGRVIRVSSCNWIYIWIGLEINLISFIPIIMCSIIDRETERSIKYFLIQSAGSGLLLLGFIICTYYPNSFISLYGGTFILVFSLLLKLGIAPFHFWVPHVISGVRWFSCAVLSVWQKLAPLFILSRFFFRRQFIFVLACLSSLVGGVGGLNQTQVRALLAYSSIGHLGWIFICLNRSNRIFIFYYIIYSLINLYIITLINLFGIKNIRVIRLGGTSVFHLVFIGGIFLSLAGIPPFLGFFPKWMVLFNLIKESIFVYMILMLLGSLINIYYYLVVIFNLLLNSFFFEREPYMKFFDNIFIRVLGYRFFTLSLIFLALFFLL